MDLNIDPEFENWIMPLQEDEYKRLEMSIIESGCRDPLVVWNGILIDGHNRYKICKEHGIDFKIHEMQFKSREDVKDWMIQNQLARRNLTKLHRTYFLGKLYLSRKLTHGGARKKGIEKENGSTSKFLGKEFNVGKATVERAGGFALDVDKIAANCGLDIRDKILSGDLVITKKDVHFLAKMDKDSQMKVIEKMRKRLSGRQAIDRLYEDKYIEEKETEAASTVFRIPCANPKCNQWFNISVKNYHKYMSMYPVQYRHALFPYCSKYCRSDMSAGLSNVH